MLDVVELACFRLEQFQKRHRLRVPDRVRQWSSDVDRETNCSSEEGVVIVAETFKDPLPRELVKETLWPLLMDGESQHKKTKTLCMLRCVCKAWMLYAEQSREWQPALDAWIIGDHRYISEFQENSYHDTSSESDPDWGYEFSDDDEFPIYYANQ